MNAASLQNFGQRHVQLNSTYQLDPSGHATLYVSQLPPNPAILTPGPAYIFVVVEGVPSIGQQIMVGSGAIEDQNVTETAVLPASFAAQQTVASTPSPSAGSKSSDSVLSATSGATVLLAVLASGVFGALATLL